MKKRIFFQKFLLFIGKFGSLCALFERYISKYRLEDVIVDTLIREYNVKILRKYIKKHSLSSYQITDIMELWKDKEAEELQLFIAEVLKINFLDEKQQHILVSINDTGFFESYLSPNGIFDVSRRFRPLVEAVYIVKTVQSVQSGKLTGIENFKAYVDNNAGDLMTDDLLAVLLKYPNNLAVKYILQKVHLTKEQEETIINTAPEELVEYFITVRELTSDQAQLTLVKKYYQLSQFYQELYKGLRSQAQQLYHQIRRQSLEKVQKVAVI